MYFGKIVFETIKSKIRSLSTKSTFQNFQQQKDEGARTIQELEAAVFNLKKDIDNQSADKLKELEADRIVLHSRLDEAKAVLETSLHENVNLKDQLRSALQESERLAARVETLEAERVQLNENLENLKKVGCDF